MIDERGPADTSITGKEAAAASCSKQVFALAEQYITANPLVVTEIACAMKVKKGCADAFIDGVYAGFVIGVTGIAKCEIDITDFVEAVRDARDKYGSTTEHACQVRDRTEAEIR